MAFITKGDIQNYLLQDIDPSFDTWIASVIEMITDYINDYCETNFENSTPSDKYYDGSGNNSIVVDEFQTVSAVKILDLQGNQMFSLVENTDYWAYPLNEDIKNKITLSQSGVTLVFPVHNRAVKVTAVWGQASVPKPIKLAALKLATKILEKGLKGGEASKERLGEYMIEYRAIDEVAEAMGINDILDGYRAIRLE